MQIDFFARRTHFIDHVLPVWRQLESERGSFFVPDAIADYARKRGVDVVALKARGSGLDVKPPRSENAMLVCSYGDLAVAHRADPKRKFIFMEHGVGITYGGHPGYAGGKGMRKKVSLFLAPNEIVRAKTEKALPGVEQVVIGTPKLDQFQVQSYRLHEPPVVCVSFHWDGSRIQPEAGNAFGHFRRVLPELARWDGFKLIGHGHPRAMDTFSKEYKKLGIEVERDFDEVMERADVYVCDNSSTIYEFLVTRKPVVLMNAPQYRRHVHWGIRFWNFTDIGPMIDQPDDLLVGILVALKRSSYWAARRAMAVDELFPYLGCSAKRAAEALREWLGNVS